MVPDRAGFPTATQSGVSENLSAGVLTNKPNIREGPGKITVRTLRKNFAVRGGVRETPDPGRDPEPLNDNDGENEKRPMKPFANTGAPAPAASENTAAANQTRGHEQCAVRPRPAGRGHSDSVGQASSRTVRAASVPPAPTAAGRDGGRRHTGQGCPANWQAGMPAPRERNTSQAACDTLRHTVPAALLLLLLALAPGLRALTLEELQNDPHLTPERLAAKFAAFKFELRPEIQPPKKFLERRAGDCDDFATLAADVLRARGYTPHLVEVRMPGYLHAVCYVAETRSYLDYNRRGSFRRAVPCNGSLTDIAARVARSFHTEWTAVAEFSWERGSERTLQTVVREPGRGLLVRPGAAPVAIQRTKGER